MNKNILIAVVLLVLFGGAIWYVRSMSAKTLPETDTPSAMMPEEGSAGVSEMMADENTREIAVEGSEFKFSLPTMTLKKGETVRLVFKNTGKMPHDWVVDELGVRTKTINSGDTDTIEFTPQQAGTFEYYCSVGAHRANGMMGALTVE